MGKFKKIMVKDSKEFNIPGFYSWNEKSIEQAIALLQDIKDNYSHLENFYMYGFDIIEARYESDYLHTTVSFNRLETDDEYADRVASIKGQKLREKDDEYQTFLKLQKKFNK